MKTDIRLIYKREYERIVHWVESHSKGYRQNLAVLGRPFIGKTFIISKILDNLPDGVTSVLIDAKEIDKTYLIRSFSNSLLASYLRGRCDSSNLEEKLRQVELGLPNTVAYIRSHINHQADFEMIFDLLTIFIRESRKRGLLVIEHFEQLESLWGREVFSLLAKKIMEMKDVMFIITSSSISRAKAILQRDLSLLFGNFEEIILTPPSPISCQDYMGRALPGLSSQAQKFIYRFTGGSPFYMDILCRKIRSSFSSKLEGEWAVIKEVIYEEIFSNYGLINQHFIRWISSLTDGPRGPQVPTFLLASTQEPRIDSLAHRFGWHRNLLEHKIDVLKEEGLVYVDHDSLFFEDYLFKFWIRNVYRLRVENAGIGEQFFRRMAMDLIENEIEDFLNQDSIPHEERIRLLFNRFRSEFIIMPDGKKRRFYKFVNIEKIDSCDWMYVAISENGYKWLYAYRVAWTESDAFEFKSVADNLKHMIQRKIMISLECFSSPVKVIAKESNVWLWDQRVLNYLLSLHGIGEILW